MKKTQLFIAFSAILAIAIYIVSCGNEASATDPLSKLETECAKYKNYSVLLADMDFDGNYETYKHQYVVLHAPLDKQDTLVSDTTAWQTVSAATFTKYNEAMGMEIMYAENGKVTRQISPPGYRAYVGNEKYGRWEERGGTRIWTFGLGYLFLRRMLWHNSYSPRYSSWNTYNSQHRGTGRAYYGNGDSKYGTKSDFNKQKSTGSKWNNQSSAFKNKVRSTATKSATKSRSSGRTGGSSRSRGGGFGK